MDLISRLVYLGVKNINAAHVNKRSFQEMPF
nr:MAG TPA: hypothetical protein [Caudoviricetes sp.]DAI62005.1 MAG TPA: hypothetical protein [Bacteriophage sp.]DAR52125.1 MAG TPA: hypothetical protein [Bacteriophage sp.]DAT46805.1 MAG TPA: hypothetical protein [Caudoviricetes sp.]DAZ38526.1 MAG TPA: hypothetical protein [Caudoviricetes sp.]